MVAIGGGTADPTLARMNSPKSYDGLSAVVFLVGLHEGVMPFVAKLWDGKPKLSLPTRLPSPAWWLVSASVIVVGFLLLWWIDSAKKRRFPDT